MFCIQKVDKDFNYDCYIDEEAKEIINIEDQEAEEKGYESIESNINDQSEEDDIGNYIVVLRIIRS